MDIGPREATNLVRVVVFDLTKQIAKIAADNAPEDEGRLKAGIKPKRERGRKHFLAASVRASPFYWRFFEYGQGPDHVEHAFGLKALQAIRPDIDDMYLKTFARKFEERLARQRKRKGG